MTRLKTGDTFPDFRVTEAFAGNTSIAELMNHKPMMFVVLRYIGCTVCRYDVHLLTQRINEFKEKGVNVCVVMQSTSENVKHDLNGDKAKACGFVHGVYEGNEQQLPAFFYVDGNGKVLVSHYAKTIVDMPSIDEMLAMII